MAGFLSAFSKSSDVEIEQAPMEQQAAGSTGSLTGVEKYLQQHQATGDSSAPVHISTTGVGKYWDNMQTPTLTGVARYLVQQIIPDYQQRAAEASKGAIQTGVEQYLARVAAATKAQQPPVASGVEQYLNRLA